MPDPVKLCSICRRAIGVARDPLSVDCGGDCWGCMRLTEYEVEDPHPPFLCAGSEPTEAEVAAWVASVPETLWAKIDAQAEALVPAIEARAAEWERL